MVHTFKGLRDEIFRLLDETASESPTTLALIKDAIRASHEQRCTEYPWSFMLWPEIVTFGITEGQRTYALHQEFHSPLYFLNQNTRSYLVDMPFRTLPGSSLDWNNDTGDTSHFIIDGSSPVIQHPSPASVVSIVSDNASDSGTSYDVVVKGETSDRIVSAEKITPTGTTTASGTVTFRRILSITKAAGWNGQMTLSDAAGNVLLVLQGCELGKQYKQIRMIEAGKSGEVIEYRFYRQPLELVNDYDVIDIPSPHGRVLVYDALIQLSGYLTETNPMNLGVWKAQQQSALASLYGAYALEGLSLGASPQYVRYIGDTFEGFPRWGSD